MSGCLCRLYGLRESRARTPIMPTTALKILASSKYKSISSSAFSSTKSIPLFRWVMARPGGSGTDRSNPSESKDTVGVAFAVQVYDTVRLHNTGRSIHGQPGQSWYGLFSGGEEKRIQFDTDAFIAHCYRCSDCGASPHERIEHNAGS